MTDNPNHPESGGPLTPAPQPEGKSAGDTLEEVASTIRDFVNKVPETINRAIDRALNVRDTTVLLRLSETASERLDVLVSAGVFKSRAEAASFLIEEGIRAQAPLFERVQSKLAEIERLREELRHSVAPEIER